MRQRGIFELKGTTMVVTAPLEPGDPDNGEEAFLAWVDKLVASRGREVRIDLTHVGSLSSTTIALCIAASRKAEEAGKRLSLVLAQRNAMAVRVSGLDRLLQVELR